jgi:hypothetical protein
MSHLNKGARQEIYRRTIKRSHTIATTLLALGLSLLLALIVQSFLGG